SCDLGGVIEFHFGTRGYFKTKILELAPSKRVVWRVIEGPEEWIGSKISFDLNQDGDEATVFFKQQGWKVQTEFMHHCSTKWAIYLMSLKSLMETGKGSPNPNDTHISGDGAD
ncbi:MAG TPA: SRPBCC domain-containing protein, partial [Polyangiaceae bacterium]|nr:SRPBCC domain-containing protein [Polyangiaceae bacterium]